MLSCFELLVLVGIIVGSIFVVRRYHTFRWQQFSGWHLLVGAAVCGFLAFAFAEHASKPGHPLSAVLFTLLFSSAIALFLLAILRFLGQAVAAANETSPPPAGRRKDLPPHGRGVLADLRGLARQGRPSRGWLLFLLAGLLLALLAFLIGTTREFERGHAFTAIVFILLASGAIFLFILAARRYLGLSGADGPPPNQQAAGRWYDAIGEHPASAGPALFPTDHRRRSGWPLLAVAFVCAVLVAVCAVDAAGPGNHDAARMWVIVHIGSAIFFGVWAALRFLGVLGVSAPVSPCPPIGQLKDFLSERLPSPERARMAAHLELCSVCQHRVEGLTAGQHSWPGLAQKLSEPAGEPEPALRKVMDQLKGGPEATRDEPALAADLPLGFLSPADKPGHIGRLERYEVLEEIGRGGMGVVLKAFDPSLHRVVAIKVLAPQLATSGVARKRFLREARAAAAVSHDHIVTIHAVDEVNGLPYLVMQYVAGGSLQDRLDKEGPLELAEVLRVGMQTASGLAAAHAHGIVHRDIKPANILLEEGVPRVKITDFGLARALDDASLTQSGFVAGSPLYMAPEQARGEALDHRADLFSLGSVLYTMCTGRPPFRAANTLAVLRRVTEDTPRPVRETNPEVPDWLVAVIERLMAKEPADRYQSAGEVVEVLGQQLAQLQHAAWVPPPPAAPPGLPTSLTICPSCGASLHVPERLVGTVVHCEKCGKPFHVEDTSEVLQVARAVPPPIGPARRPRFRLRWLAVAGVLASLLLAVFLLFVLYALLRSPVPYPPAQPMSATVAGGRPHTTPVERWVDLQGLPAEATAFGAIQLDRSEALRLDDDRLQTLVRLVLPRVAARQVTTENLGRVSIDGAGLACYEKPADRTTRFLFRLSGTALDGHKRIVDSVQRTGGDGVAIEAPRGGGPVYLRSADWPFDLKLADDYSAYLGASVSRQDKAPPRGKLLEGVPSAVSVLTGYNPPWVRTALANIPPDACGFFLGEIPETWHRPLSEALGLWLRVYPRSFLCHVKKTPLGMTLYLTLNVDRARDTATLRDDLERWRQQFLAASREKNFVLGNAPETQALVGGVLQRMQWKASGETVQTEIFLPGNTWKALASWMK